MVPSWESRIVCACCDCLHPPTKIPDGMAQPSSRGKPTRMTVASTIFCLSNEKTRRLLGEGDEVLPNYIYGDYNNSLFYIIGSLYKEKQYYGMSKGFFLTFARLDLEIPAILQPGKLQGESVHLWNLTSPKFKIDTKRDGLEKVSQVSNMMSFSGIYVKFGGLYFS